MGRKKTHGLSQTYVFRVWNGMMQRCYNANRTEDYYLYGGRGITVCPEWHDAAMFAAWALANGCREGFTLDRIDSNGNYEPTNCRFATPREQSRNRRSNTLVTAFGESKLLIEWAEDDRCKVTYKTLHKRIAIRGWAPEDAITKPNLAHGYTHMKRTAKRGVPHAS